MQVFFGHDAVCHQPAHRIISPAHVRDFQPALVIVETANVSHLAARFGIDGGAVEHHLRFGARLDLVGPSFFGNDGFDAAIVRACPEVKIRLGVKRLAKPRVYRIRRFLATALPRGFRARPLLVHRRIEARPIDFHTGIACHILDEISGQSVRIVEPKRLTRRCDRIAAKRHSGGRRVALRRSYGLQFAGQLRSSRRLQVPQRPLGKAISRHPTCEVQSLRFARRGVLLRRARA